MVDSPVPRRRHGAGVKGKPDDPSNVTNNGTAGETDETKKALLKEKTISEDDDNGKNKIAGPTSKTRVKSNRNVTLATTILFAVAGLASRYYKIDWSDKVVWDEAHFGKFASYYLNRTFYFDVHPPLGKMMLGLSGFLAGYDGHYTFESGKQYPEDVNFVAMRYFTATFGALCVPLAYLTGIELGFSHVIASLFALLVLTDNGMIVISKFILLDPLLLLGTSLSLYGLALFHSHRKKPFTLKWWAALAFTGVSLGLVSSVKWVGLFVVALVGFYTIDELWELWGDLSVKPTTYTAHWGARIATLIATPVALYAFSFILHFAILVLTGPGDGQMPSRFQVGLIGSNIQGGPKEVAYNSVITLKNSGYNGALLHSHPHLYPDGSHQQQVTGYHHKDNNNNWVVRKKRDEKYSDTPEIVKNGDIIRLQHQSTTRNLHSHKLPAPVTTVHYEVSGYGNETVGDHHDYWKVEIADDADGTVDTIRTLTTRLRLKHEKVGCYLRMHNVFLPEWGYKQAEVTCDKRKDPDGQTLFNVENHWNPKLPPMPKSHYKSPFWTNFIHLNVAMWSSNQALKKDPDKEDLLISEPWMWPLMYQGIRMCSWGDKDIKYYMIANPLAWWSGTAAIVLYLVMLFIYQALFKRRYVPITRELWERFKFAGKLALGGWLCHYLPFFLVGRVTYLHHYFPAAYFSFLMVAFLFEHVKVLIGPRATIIWYAAVAIYATAIIASFVFFSPLTYGFDTPKQTMSNREWLPKWNIAQDR